MTGLTLARAAEGARKDASRYQTCIAITSGDPEDGYGWCPLDNLFLLHGPLVKAGIVRIVDLVGCQHPTMSDKAAMVRLYGGGK